MSDRRVLRIRIIVCFTGALRFRSRSLRAVFNYGGRCGARSALANARVARLFGNFSVERWLGLKVIVLPQLDFFVNVYCRRNVFFIWVKMEFTR